MAEWNLPNDRKYARTDEWIKLDGEEALIGISDYAQGALSDIVFIELPKVGASFEAGKSFGTIESVKAASDLNMPAGGTVIAVNDSLEDAPERLNSDPNGLWLVRIKLSNPRDLDGLMDSAAYAKYCQGRG